MLHESGDALIRFIRGGCHAKHSHGRKKKPGLGQSGPGSLPVPLPWVIGFASDTTATWNAWIAAIVLGALAVATLSAFAEWEEWANMVIGLWLIVSPWILGFMANVNAMWTHVILGVLVAAIAAWAVWDYRHHMHA